MITDDLHDALERATDAVEPVGMAALALTTARRRRTLRRGLAAGVVSAAAVVGVVVAVQGARAPVPDPAGPPAASSPANPSNPASPSSPEIIVGPEGIPVAPTIAVDRIQPRWDPRGVEGLPVVDLGVPRVLPLADSGSVTRAVALLDGDAETLLVGEDGAQEELELPEEVESTWPAPQLSPDGRRVAVLDTGSLFWRELDGGSWQQVSVPESASSEASVTWLPDSDSVILRGYGPVLRLDLSTDARETLPELRSYVSWGADPAGWLTYQQQGPRVVSEYEGGGLRRHWLGPLTSIQNFAVSDESLAATRLNGGFYGGRRDVDEYGGLIALERETLATRAFLPVPTSINHTWYEGDALRPLSWLDEDTVLFTVTPVDAPKQYLATWDVASGELSRISCWPKDYRASFATDLLASRMTG